MELAYLLNSVWAVSLVFSLRALIYQYLLQRDITTKKHEITTNDRLEFCQAPFYIYQRIVLI